MAVAGYSRAQVGLHWIIAVLIILNLFIGESMGEVERALRDGSQASVLDAFLSQVHVWSGIAILLLALIRLLLRHRRGVPALPVEEPPLMKLAAAGTHFALYAAMILMPVSGMLAWFGGVNLANEAHEIGKPLLILFVVLHVGGALYHQFVLRSDVMRRMTRPSG